MKNINPINLLWISGISIIVFHIMLFLCMLAFMLILVSIIPYIAEHIPQFLLFEYKLSAAIITLFVALILYTGYNDSYFTFFRIKNVLKEIDSKYKAKNFKEMAHIFLIHILCLNYLRNISYNNMLHSFAFNSIAIILLTLLIIGL